VKFAIWPLVTYPNEAAGGSPSGSRSQAPAISSTTAAAGAATYRPAFWSYAEVSMSAASDAGTVPPITNP